MLKYFQNKYAMSEKGAKDLFRSIIWTVIMDISFMVPVVLSFKFLDEYISLLLNSSSNSQNSIYYVIMSIAFFLVMLVIAYFQYNSTYTKIYEESARRRISLAETLKKATFSFFW